MKNTADREIIVTKQMVRDVLTFKGPTGLTELLRNMKLGEEYRTLVHEHLVSLQDRGTAQYLVESGTWISTITLN